MELSWLSCTNSESPLGQGRDSSFPKAVGLRAPNKRVGSTSQEGGWNMGHGHRGGPFYMLSYRSIFSVQSPVHLAVYRLVCLSVDLSVTPGGLPCLSMSVCVSICTPVYLCLYLSFGLSINKSINEFVCLLSVSICLCPSIHLEFLSTSALLSLTCPIFLKWIAHFSFSLQNVWNNSWNSSLWTKHWAQGPHLLARDRGRERLPEFPPSTFHGIYHLPSSQVLPRDWAAHGLYLWRSGPS